MCNLRFAQQEPVSQELAFFGGLGTVLTFPTISRQFFPQSIWQRRGPLWQWWCLHHRNKTRFWVSKFWGVFLFCAWFISQCFALSDTSLRLCSATVPSLVQRPKVLSQAASSSPTDFHGIPCPCWMLQLKFPIPCGPIVTPKVIEYYHLCPKGHSWTLFTSESR